MCGHIITLLTSPPVVTMNTVVTPLTLSNPKTIEQPVLVHQIRFHLFDGSGCSGGGLSVPRELLHGHLCFLSAGGWADIMAPQAAREA